MQKNRFTKIIWILFYIFVFVFLLKNSYNYLDPDLGWHLKVGEQILTEKQVPDINYYNYTLNGQKWVDHEWLSDAIMFWLYNNFGYLSLNLLFAFIALATLIILNIFTRKYFLKNKKAMLFIIAFQILGLFVMSPHIGVRIQEIALLNILLLLIIIHLYEKKCSDNLNILNQAGTEQRNIQKKYDKNYKILFWLPFLFYFWACLHGTFLIGLFILFLWIGIKLLKSIIDRDWTILKNTKIFFLFTILSITATFFTPYGIKLYSFLNDYKNTYYLKHIQEWLPMHYLPIQYWQLLYSAIVAAVIILLILQKRPNLRDFFKNRGGSAYSSFIWHIALSILFLILAFKSKRNSPILFIVSFPIVTAFFSNFLALPKKILNLNWEKPLFIIKSCITISLLALIFYISININFFADPFSRFCSNYPCEAVEFLKENPQYHDLNIFNNYGWGGYLIWVWPEKQLFIDGRMPQYKFAGHTMLEEYFEFYQEEKAKNKLSQYDIKLVLLKIDKPYKINWFEKYALRLNEEKINDQKNYLKDYLEDSNGWEEIYNDEASKVYVKK